MATAAYLSKYFKRITIIESDDVLNDVFMKSTPSEILDYRCRLESPTSLGRSGDKLFNEYGVRTYSLKTDLRLAASGIILNQDLTEDFDWLGIDRFTLEIVLRREFCLKFSNQVEWKCNSRVTELIVDRSLNIVKGVKYRSKKNTGSPSLEIYGDFIIDCTGHNTSSPKWLKEKFNLIVPTIQIHYGCGYVTCIGERFRTGDPSLDSVAVIGSSVNSPENNFGFIITPMRTIDTTDHDSLGILATLAINCVNSEYPPNDSYENLLEWAKENLDQEYYAVLKSIKVCSPLLSYRRAVDARKYVETLGKKWPQNYILLGDAICALNPQYAQGMTHALRHARELEKIFDESCHMLKDISHIFNRRATVITEECWFASTANDWKTPTLKVIETHKNGEVKTYQRGNDSSTTNNLQLRVPLKIRFMQWYSYWFLQCAAKSGQLSTDFMRVVQQQGNSSILMKPTTFFTVIHMALMSYVKNWNFFGGRSAH
ncbi:unnamed protein product [Rotaria sp. Silwood2]|nr:unnamed protein product [Rotaria sp. Silwood2]